MFLMPRAFIGFTLLMLSLTAHAATITVDVVDDLHVNLAFSGVLTGSVPNNTPGVLWIDTPVPSSIEAIASGVTGGSIGSVTEFVVYSGYNNTPYGGSLEIWNSTGSNSPFSVGGELTGSLSLTFNVQHGMTQSMFDEGGVPIYWGRDSGTTAGTLQGYAVSSVPIPAAAWLFISALGGLVVAKRKQLKA
ncbi:MAG: hypothetical protein ACI8QT_000892 [Halioglobus sp.]|jgi:hypothetical protein